ncbi:hypothetical protein MRX96_038425 [Rhipicephalus microplus]
MFQPSRKTGGTSPLGASVAGATNSQTTFSFVPAVPFKFTAPPVESAPQAKYPYTTVDQLGEVSGQRCVCGRGVCGAVREVHAQPHHPSPQAVLGHEERRLRHHVLWQSARKDKVCITDLHPSGFYGLLRYLYCGTCEPDSFEEAIHIREAADKYLVPDLVAVCSKYIKENMSPDRVCPLLDCLATTDIDRVDNAALQTLKNDGLSVLNSESFTDALDSTVESVLKVVRGVPESCIFLAIRRWAEEKCRKSLSTSETPLELKAVLRPFLPKLRFLALTPQEYVQGPGSWNVLEDQEDFAILRNIIVRGSVPLPLWVCTDDTVRGQLILKDLFERPMAIMKKEVDSVADGNEKLK